MRTADLVADVDLDSRKFDRKITAVNRAIDILTRKDTTAKVTADTDRAESNVSSLARSLAGIPDENVAITGDASNAVAAAGRVSAELAGISDEKVLVTVAADVGQVGSARSAIKALPDSHKVAVEVDTGAIDDAKSQIAGLAGTGAAVAGAAVGGGFMAGMSAAINEEAAGDLVRAATQNLPAITEDLGGVAGEVYRNAFGSSLEEIGPIVQTVAAGLGKFTDGSAGAIQDLTERAFTLSDVLGIDMLESIGAVQAMIVNGLAPDGAAAFDLIFAGASRLSGPARDELISAVNEYALHFRNLGFSGEESMSLLANAVGGGNIAVDKAADAVKEFGIRAIDGSEASGEAFAAAGLDAKEMARQIAAGGPTARDAFGQTIDAILAIKDPIAQNEAAIALFGTQVEDLGGVTGLSDLRASMTSDLGQISGSLGEAGEAAYDNFGTRASEAFREFMGALGNLADKALPIIDRVSEAGRALIDFFATGDFTKAFGDAFNVSEDSPVVDVLFRIRDTAIGVVRWFQDNWPTIQRVIGQGVDWIEKNVIPVVAEVAGFLIAKFGEVVTWTKEIWPQVSEAIGHVINVIKWAWETFGGDIAESARVIWDTVKSVVEGGIQAVQGIIETVLAIINGDWGKAWDGIKKTFGGVWDAIFGIVRGALNLIEGVIGKAWDTIKGIFSAAWEGIKGLAISALGWIVDKILWFAETTVGAIAAAFSGIPGLGPMFETAKGVISSFRERANIEFGLLSSEPARAQVNALHDAIDAVPGFKPVTITADTAQARATIASFLGTNWGPIILDMQADTTTIHGQVSGWGKARFHEGGVVPGSGEVPAVLLSGEGVLPREVMAKIGPEGFNSLMRMHEGGIAGWTAPPAVSAPSFVPPSAASGGSSSPVDQGLHLHFHGTFVGGEAGIREVARKITAAQNAHNYRSGV